MLRHQTISQEGTLAGPFTPVVLAVIAAVTTGAVVAGVVTGPTVMRCIERGDFGQCIGEAYFGAEPAVAEAGPVAEETIAVTAQEPEPEAADEEPAAAPAVAPAFAVVRVEPDGSAVIAGTAAPASEIRIFANDDLLGSETTESSGDFAHVTASPLPSGGVELRLLDVASGEFATTSIVVIVAEDRASEPLVVASEPGQASEILQGLDTAPVEPVQLAEAPQAVAEEPVAEAAEPEPVAIAVEDAPVEDAPVESVPEIAQSQEPVAEAAAPEPIVAEEPVAVEEPVAAEAGTVAEAVGESVVVEPEAVAIAAEEPEAVASVAETDAVQAEAVEEEVAAIVEPVQEEAPEPAIVIVPPTIDAVEIDGDRNFFAGGGSEGLAVRLYVENRAVGTSEVQDGRWLVEAINVLTAAAQRIRVDMLNADGSVAGRAEVDFVIDLPEPEVEPEPAEIPAPAPVEEPVAVAETPVPVSEPEPAAVAQPEAEAAPQAEPEPIAAQEAAEAPVPTMVGTTTGDRTISGQVIIRRGDNLWTIARRVYGEGLRYTQIFEANTTQIRNPDLIYPGQVFDLPGTDVVIGDEQ